MLAKEVAELKKRMKKGGAQFDRICGCYVNADKQKVCTFNERFLNLEEEEFYKYLDIASKSLSGKLGNNLLNLEFPMDEEEVGGRQHSLLALRDTCLENEDMLNSFYNHIIDTFDYEGNYLIVLFHGNYDVIRKSSDRADLDESEEVYSYILCAICPVDLAKPALGYREAEQRIGSRIRDWVVGSPNTAFLFPAFDDRSSNIHATLLYTKNTKEPHAEFIEDGLGCPVVRTNTEKKEIFDSIVKNNISAKDNSKEVVLQLQQAIFEQAEEYEGEHGSGAAMTLDKNALEAALKTCALEEREVHSITKSFSEVLGEDNVIAQSLISKKMLEENELILEKKALEEQVGELTVQLDKMETKNGKVKIVTPTDQALEKTSLNGKEYWIIPTDDADVVAK